MLDSSFPFTSHTHSSTSSLIPHPVGSSCKMQWIRHLYTSPVSPLLPSDESQTPPKRSLKSVNEGTPLPPQLLCSVAPFHSEAKAVTLQRCSSWSSDAPPTPTPTPSSSPADLTSGPAPARLFPRHLHSSLRHLLQLAAQITVHCEAHSPPSVRNCHPPTPPALLPNPPTALFSQSIAILEHMKQLTPLHYFFLSPPIGFLSREGRSFVLFN